MQRIPRQIVERHKCFDARICHLGENVLMMEGITVEAGMIVVIHGVVLNTNAMSKPGIAEESRLQTLASI